MDIKQGRMAGARPASIIGLGCIAVILAAAPAAANTACSLPAVQSLGVTGLTITAATDHPATATLPEYCELRGTVATDGLGAGPNSASIHADLPANWNGKFLTTGQGGFAGTDGLPGVSVGSPVARGYAVSTTDTGHQAGGTDARWALNADGSPATAKIADYYYRAVHQVAVTSKALVKAFYGAGSISRSYFAGCSNGGRQAYNEATKFPDDFDGIIAGDPFLDIRALIAGLKFHKQNLQSVNTFLPASKLPMIDAAVRASCDAADGVVDGLIQNPAKCSFNPNSLVTASCAPGDNTCLTQGQADTLRNYFTALRDDDGHVIYTGAAVSDLGGGDGMDLWSTGFFAPGQALPTPNTQSTFDVTAPEPWGNAGFSPASIGWQFVDHGIQYLVERNPAFNVRSFDANSPIGVESDRALKLFDRRTEAGDGDQPAKLLPFIAKDRKMLIYHGLSDPALPAFRTINHYEAVADLVEGGIGEPGAGQHHRQEQYDRPHHAALQIPGTGELSRRSRRPGRDQRRGELELQSKEQGDVESRVERPDGGRGTAAGRVPRRARRRSMTAAGRVPQGARPVCSFAGRRGRPATRLPPAPRGADPPSSSLGRRVSSPAHRTGSSTAHATSAPAADRAAMPPIRGS